MIIDIETVHPIPGCFLKHNFPRSGAVGDVVYLKTDNQQLPRIVTEICLQGGTMSNYIILYELAQSDVESKHYDSEISKTKDKNLTLGI